MASSQVAENYQLKWHSHLTNLNSSVATLYRNDKFADVLLFTSHSDGGCGIPAHKIILSSCSHFFASIFDSNQSPPNSMIYIVLPPELSKRSIQILIQYMYSGEATVSNDILNEVLRGGEVLKIRGLWRNNQSTEPNASSTPQYMPVPKSDTGNPPCSKDSQMYIEKTIYEHRPERINSTSSLPVLKESPLNVMSPPHPQIQKPSLPPPVVTSMIQSGPPLLHPSNPNPHLSSSHGHSILVKKEVAIDPGDASEMSPPSHYSHTSHPLSVTAKKTQHSPDKRLKTIHENGGGVSDIHPLNHHASPPSRYPTTPRRYSDDHMLPREVDVLSERIRDSEVLRHSSDKRRISVTEHQRSTGHHHLEPGEKPPQASAHFVPKPKRSEVQIPEALSFLTIKQEPVEWSDYEAELEKSHIEVTVKPELVYGDQQSDGEDEDPQELVYSPLTCELCSETFTIPGDWVRHIESHAEASHCVPKKRKRIEHEPPTDNIAALRCDLCSMYFVTPAEWVRHVQNTHTETELALSNNSPPKRSHRSPRPIDGPPLDKNCTICKKSFPSYASMVIHKRTHTGERPFYCSICNKGFNVKSNLLRHMRTLHNQLLNPSNVTDGQLLGAIDIDNGSHSDE